MVTVIKNSHNYASDMLSSLLLINFQLWNPVAILATV